jgi:hypothetical protein
MGLGDKDKLMLVKQTKDCLSWDALDLSWSSIERDWYGQAMAVPASFALVTDKANLWFVAKRDQPPKGHPDTVPYEFTPGLWRYDVAELFIRDACSDRYMEFNLAPNGAWWSAEFDRARDRSSTDDILIHGVKTYAAVSAGVGWQAAASIPLTYLKSAFGFGKQSAINVAFIVNSPQQAFLSKAQLPGSEPDYHQPDYFEQIELKM